MTNLNVKINKNKKNIDIELIKKIMGLSIDEIKKL